MDGWMDDWMDIRMGSMGRQQSNGYLCREALGDCQHACDGDARASSCGSTLSYALTCSGIAVPSRSQHARTAALCVLFFPRCHQASAGLFQCSQSMSSIHMYTWYSDTMCGHAFA